MMFIQNKFELCAIVYLKTDVNQYMRYVTEINVSTSGILYRLAFGSAYSWNHEWEISEEKNVLISV